MAREERGKAAESLTGAWQHMDGQMMMILMALCRSVEDLPGDLSYVLIGDLTEVVILVAMIELLAVKIQPWHL